MSAVQTTFTTTPVQTKPDFKEFLESLEAGYIKVPVDGLSKAIPVEGIIKVYGAYQEGREFHKAGGFNHQPCLSLNESEEGGL